MNQLNFERCAVFAVRRVIFLTLIELRVGFFYIQNLKKQRSLTLFFSPKNFLAVGNLDNLR
jgi:hypothetical protein